MKILAVSMKFPTLLQTWFVNYLRCMENFAERIEVISLLDPDADYDPNIDSLTKTSVTHTQFGKKHSTLKGCWHLLKNLKEDKTRQFLAHLIKSAMPLKDKIVALQLCPLVNSFNPDLVHCHSEKAAYRLLPLLQTLDVPIYLTFHGLPPDGVRDLSSRQREVLYTSIDSIVTNTEFSKTQCLEHAPWANDIRIIPQGINLEDFPYQPHLPPEQGNFIALTVGRLDRLKGHKSVLNAISNLVKSGVAIEYWIVGAGLYEKALKDEIQASGMERHVKMIGVKTGDDLKAIYRKAHFFILPSITEPGSWAETQGIVVQEAQASGLLTVCSDSGGIPECIRDDVDGFLYQQGSSEKLSERLRYLIENIDQWGKWQDNARAQVEQHFSMEKMGERLNTLYRERIPASKGPALH